MTYAIIINGVVTAAFVGDDVFASAYYPGSIRIDNLNPIPGVGWTYLNGHFTPPTPTPPPVPSSTVFAKPDFMNLFSLDELTACFGYADNPALSTDQKSKLNVFFAFFNNAPVVDLTSAATIQGVELLEAYGLIAAGRAATILASRN